MNNYGYNGSFAHFYDKLTQNISYHSRAVYIDKLISLHGGKKGLLLDLACGTGSLSEEMCRLGYDIIAVDGSVEMLNAAIEKKMQSGLNIQYLCQNMPELDMFGTIDVTICMLDSLNHLPDFKAWSETVRRVSLFCENGGLFIFDVNTPFKHKNILGGNTFVYDLDDIYCVWQNCFADNRSDFRVDINLDFFALLDNGNYSRSEENFAEIAFERDVIERLLTDNSFEILARYDYDSFNPDYPESEKLVYVAKRKFR